jgi:hypothetical protein
MRYTKQSEAAREKAKEKTRINKLLYFETSWEGLPIDWDQHEGFVYLVTNNLTGKAYIGLKHFWIRKKTKLIGESNWRTYKSSSYPLLKDLELLGTHNFTFTILSCHRTIQDTIFAEAAEQIKRNVLKEVLEDGTAAYYNDNILSKFFRPKDFGTKEYYEKCDQISKRLKEGYARGFISHPMKGKVHPNKGKKLPQTGHKKNTGKIWVTNGTKNILLKSMDSIPEGFSRGLAMKKRPTIKKEPVQRESKICPHCLSSFIPHGTQTYCTPEHMKEAKRIRFMERYREKMKNKPDKRRKENKCL